MPPKQSRVKRAKTSKPMRPKTKKTPARPKRLVTSAKVLRREMPATYGNSVVSTAPRMSMRSGGLTITKTELLDQLYVFSNVASTGQIYRAVAFGINPGNALLFPWLINTARCWQSYRFKKLAIRYVPAAPTSQAGDVMLAFAEDPATYIPGQQAAFNNITGSTIGSAFLSQRCQWSGASVNGAWKRMDYTTAYTFANGTPRLASLNHAGALFVGYEVPSTSVSFELGKLYLDYEVEFRDAVQPGAVLTTPSGVGLSPFHTSMTSDFVPVGSQRYNIPPTGTPIVSGYYNPFKNGFAGLAASRYLNDLAINFVGLNSSVSPKFANQVRMASGIRFSRPGAVYNNAYADSCQYSALDAVTSANKEEFTEIVTIVPDTQAASARFFPLVQFGIPGQFLITLTHTFQFGGTILTGSDPTATSQNIEFVGPDSIDPLTGPAAPFGKLLGSFNGNRYGTPIYSGGSVIGYCIRLMFYAVIPSSSTFPVMARMPIDGFALTGISVVSSSTTEMTIAPYLREITLESPAPAASFAIEDVVERVLARMRIEDAKEDDCDGSETPPSPVLCASSNERSGSGPLSQSGFTLLSDLLSRHGRK